MTYFTNAQVYQHHTGEGGFVDNSIAVYSFALKPEDTSHLEPVTSLALIMPNLSLVLLMPFTSMLSTTMFSVSFYGMGGLAYSN